MSALPNGFKISTWTELLALLSIIVMAGAGILWGLKLDGRTVEIVEIRARQDNVRERLTATEERVRASAERLSAIEERINRIERESRP
jgi:hypothetical protein